MGRYFGTDGIRGKANETLDVQRAFQVGRYLGYYFSRQRKGRILVGKDTRLSSGMFETRSQPVPRPAAPMCIC